MATSEYTVKTDSGEYTVLLTEDEAKARGLKPTEKKAQTASNKSATPANKGRRSEAASKAFGAKKSDS